MYSYHGYRFTRSTAGNIYDAHAVVLADISPMRYTDWGAVSIPEGVELKFYGRMYYDSIEKVLNAISLDGNGNVPGITPVMYCNQGFFPNITLIRPIGIAGSVDLSASCQ